MSDPDQPDEHQLKPDEPMTTRREAMAAGAALMPMFLFGDDSDLGYFDTHRVLDTDANDETVTDLGIDPEVLAFAEGLTVEERPDGGVQITAKADSELSQWAERDDGTLEGPALSTGEINNVHVVPTDASDWGSAVNSILSSASESAPVIYTPPGEYGHSTTVTPSKPVLFLADGMEKGQANSSITVIDRSGTDTEFIKPDSGVSLYIKGYQFQGDDTGAADAVYTRGYTIAEWCDGLNLGTGNVFHVDPGANDENINGSQFEHVGGRQVERVVYTQDGTNSNDIKATIDLAFNCNVAAYEQEGGSSHEIYVGQFEGSTSPAGAVVLNGSRNKAFVRRVETSSPAVEFNDSTNYGVVLYNVTGDDFVFNNSNNRAVNIGSAASFIDQYGNWRHNDGAFRVDGTGRIEYGAGDFTVTYDSSNDRLDFKSDSNGRIMILEKTGDLYLEGAVNENQSI